MDLSNLRTDFHPLPISFGGRIKAVRLTWGWSQQKLAEAVNVDQASISFWERDKIKPSGTGLLALWATTLCGVRQRQLHQCMG